MSNKTSIEGLSALLHTLMLIPQHRWITVRELQQQLALLDIHRTTRSIKRYLDEVIVDVFNVECDSMSMPHVYRKTSEQLLKLNKQEMLYWQLTNKYLLSVVPDEFNYGLGRSSERDNPLCQKGSIHTEEQAWLEKIHVALPNICDWSKEQRHILNAVHTALLHNRMLKISSQVLQQEKAFIEPLGLSIQCDALLLLFRLSGQHTIHALALTLIDEASVSTFSFTYPADFNLEQFMREHNEISAP
ncbi:transcriptional regulator [Vibrio parahaemolyticus]|uniref:transcriptional regulator n=1 Tax=Vibrio parahaemolyticus TaxID=670 RepID=UPI0011EFE167|nr:transcriptional regulator [Vibrio parahaemolyticus]MCX4128947.1 transcriptional regulator [Vibrio parahaemolyticus]QHH13540.1 transcriptional regulator [Vibrio parahaemolyticus]WHT07887.1 transcriptional regulator [Vibrio parahaemolyticus]HCD5142256.1 transcriptional regulator [Vibrio parahaemolyticus]